MANETAVSINMTVTDAGGNINGNVSFQEDFAGGGAIANEQTIGTSAEALVFGDVGTPKSVFVKNTDPDNFVEIDAVSTMDAFPQKLMPGQGILLKPQTATIYAKADTASCKVWVVAA